MNKDIDNYYMSEMDAIKDYQWARLELAWEIYESLDFTLDGIE